MKLVFKLLIAVAIIAFASTKAMRTESKTQDGDGTWDKGYNCPKIYFNLQGQAEEDMGKAKIVAKQMVDSPTDEDKLGFVLQFDNNGKVKDVLKNIAVFSANKMYIPWRNFNTVKEPEYTNPWGSNKYIVATVNGDDKKTYTLKIVLPYKLVGYYISDTEGKKIALKMLNMANELRGNVRSSKVDVVNSTNNLIDINASIEKVKKDKDAAKKAFEADLEKLEKTKTALEADLKKKAENSATAALAYEKTQKAYGDTKQKLSVSQSQIFETKNNLEILKDQNTAVVKLEKKQTKSSDDLKEKIDFLKKIAANKVNDLQKAEDEARKFKLPQVKTELGKIVPSY